MKPLLTTLQFGLLAAVDNVKHCLLFITGTLVSCRKASLVVTPVVLADEHLEQMLASESSFLSVAEQSSSTVLLKCCGRMYAWESERTLRIRRR